MKGWSFCSVTKTMKSSFLNSGHVPTKVGQQYSKKVECGSDIWVVMYMRMRWLAWDVFFSPSLSIVFQEEWRSCRFRSTASDTSMNREETRKIMYEHASCDLKCLLEASKRRCGSRIAPVCTRGLFEAARCNSIVRRTKYPLQQRQTRAVWNICKKGQLRLHMANIWILAIENLDTFNMLSILCAYYDKKEVSLHYMQGIIMQPHTSVVDIIMVVSFQLVECLIEFE